MHLAVARTAAALSALLALVPPSATAKRRREPCPGAGYAAAEALVGSGASDTIVIDDRQVAIAGKCDAVRARRKVTKRRTVLRVRWRTCGDERRITLVARLENATCASIAGVLRKKGVAKRRFTAVAAEPPDAYGRASDPLPPGAALVTREELEALKAAGPWHDASPAQDAADEAALAVLAAEDTKLVDGVAATSVDLAARLVLPEPAPDADDHDAEIVDVKGRSRTVRLLGRRAWNALVATGLRREPTLENQLDRYRAILALVAADPVAAAAVGPLAPVDDVAPLGTARVKSLNHTLTLTLKDLPAPIIPGGTPPPGHPSTCDAEEQAGAGTDRTEWVNPDNPTGAPCPHQPAGLYQQFAWPLKFYATCVKDQATRGTCVAFSTNGAVELLVAKKFGRWVNLAEQYLEFMMKASWYPSTWGDSPGWNVDWQVPIKNAFATPFEPDWDYNPSWSRIVHSTSETFTDSCTGYGGDQASYCSDTAHQGRLVCIDVKPWRFCISVAPPVTTPGATFRPTMRTELWDAYNPGASLEAVRLALRQDPHPLVLAFRVPAVFKQTTTGFVPAAPPNCPVYLNPDNDKWYCQLVGACECPSEGHAVLATAAIDNGELLSGMPGGAGGGYLVIKNSWGTCAGDGGYYYLNYQAVQDYAVTATVLLDVAM